MCMNAFQIPWESKSQGESGYISFLKVTFEKYSTSVASHTLAFQRRVQRIFLNDLNCKNIFDFEFEFPIAMKERGSKSEIQNAHLTQHNLCQSLYTAQFSNKNLSHLKGYAVVTVLHT